MKEDREKAVLQKKQQSLASLKRVRESIHHAVLLQALLKWRLLNGSESAMENVKSSYTKELKSIKEQSQQQISILEGNLRSMEEESKSKSELLNAQYTNQIKQNALHRIQSILKLQKQQQLVSAFFIWKNRSAALSLSAQTADQLKEKETVMTSLQNQLQTVYLSSVFNVAIRAVY